MNWSKKKKAVVPIDFSDASFRAVDEALEIVGDAAAIHLMHVLPKLSAAEPGVIWGSVNDQSRAEQVRESVQEHLAAAKYAGLHISVEFGDPGHEIVDFAKRISADLIVIPCQGRTGIERLLVGSVAERVVRLSPCDVLVLRG